MALDAFHASAIDHTDGDLSGIRSATADLVNRPRLAYEGGQAAIAELMRKDLEDATSWRNRQNHFRNVPVVGTALPIMAWLVWSGYKWDVWVGDKPPDLMAQQRAKRDGTEIQEDTRTADVADWFRDTLEDNQFPRITHDATIARQRDGLGVVRCGE